jgi:hypothetical protein
MSHISVALMAQYLNVRQRKLDTIIIQTVHILQHDNADTGSLPVEDFVKQGPTYFQIIQPGSRTVTPPYQWTNCQNYETFLLNYAQKVIVFKFKALMKPTLPPNPSPPAAEISVSSWQQ